MHQAIYSEFLLPTLWLLNHINARIFYQTFYLFIRWLWLYLFIKFNIKIGIFCSFDWRFFVHLAVLLFLQCSIHFKWNPNNIDGFDIYRIDYYGFDSITKWFGWSLVLDLIFLGFILRFSIPALVSVSLLIIHSIQFTEFTFCLLFWIIWLCMRMCNVHSILFT